MYSKITNPITGRKISINGKLGKTILRNYLLVLKGGAEAAAAITAAREVRRPRDVAARKIFDFLEPVDKLSVKKTERRSMSRMAAKTLVVDLESDEALDDWYSTSFPVYIFKLDLYNIPKKTRWGMSSQPRPTTPMDGMDGVSVIRPNIEKLLECAKNGAICELHIKVSDRDENIPQAIVFEGIEKCLTLRKIRVFDGRNYAYGNYTIPSFFFPSITEDEVLHDLTIELTPRLDGSIIMDPEYLTLNNTHALKWLLNSMGNEIIIRGNHTNMFTTPDSIRSPISDWETLVSANSWRRPADVGAAFVDPRPVFDEELTKLRQLIDMYTSIGPIKIIIEEAEFFTMIDTNNCHSPGRLRRLVCSDESTIPKFKESAIKPDAFNMLSEYGFVREVVTPDWWETPVVRVVAGSTTNRRWMELPRDETYLDLRIKAPSTRERNGSGVRWVLDPLSSP